MDSTLHLPRTGSRREKDKDVSQLANLALTLYFHYHNMGPSIWGPRRGSHAFTGRPYPSVYTYRGPAPGIDPVSMDAYRFGKTVLEIGDVLVEHAWDRNMVVFTPVLLKISAHRMRQNRYLRR